MSKIEWTPALSVGVENIDQEHKKLIAICNKMAFNVKGVNNIKTTAEGFKELRAYTVYHFSNEKKFQSAIGYPDLKNHSKEHDKLRKSVKAYQQSLYRQG